MPDNLHSVLRRDGAACTWCGHPLTADPLVLAGFPRKRQRERFKATRDRVSLEGTHALPNIVAACRWCNAGRGDLPFMVWFDDCEAGGLAVREAVLEAAFRRAVTYVYGAESASIEEDDLVRVSAGPDALPVAALVAELDVDWLGVEVLSRDSELADVDQQRVPRRSCRLVAKRAEWLAEAGIEEGTPYDATAVPLRLLRPDVLSLGDLAMLTGGLRRLARGKAL